MSLYKSTKEFNRLAYTPKQQVIRYLLKATKNTTNNQQKKIKIYSFNRRFKNKKTIERPIPTKLNTFLLNSKLRYMSQNKETINSFLVSKLRYNESTIQIKTNLFFEETEKKYYSFEERGLVSFNKQLNLKNSLRLFKQQANLIVKKHPHAIKKSKQIFKKINLFNIIPFFVKYKQIMKGNQEFLDYTRKRKYLKKRRNPLKLSRAQIKKIKKLEKEKKRKLANLRNRFVVTKVNLPGKNLFLQKKKNNTLRRRKYIFINLFVLFKQILSTTANVFERFMQLRMYRRF